MTKYFSSEIFVQTDHVFRGQFFQRFALDVAPFGRVFPGWNVAEFLLPFSRQPVDSQYGPVAPDLRIIFAVLRFRRDQKVDRDEGASFVGCV